MYAALVEVSVAGVDRDSGIAGLRNHLVPAIRSMPGFLSGTWLTGGGDETGLSLTVGRRPGPVPANAGPPDGGLPGTMQLWMKSQRRLARSREGQDGHAEHILNT
jgi:hypothetical protein